MINKKDVMLNFLALILAVLVFILSLYLVAFIVLNQDGGLHRILFLILGFIILGGSSFSLYLQVQNVNKEGKLNKIHKR